MKVAIVNEAVLPVPPVLGGAVEQILYETAQAVRKPELAVISRWCPELKGAAFDAPDVFYHVDVRAQEERVRTVLGGRVRVGLGRALREKEFYYLNGVADLIEAIRPDVIEAHHCPRFVSYFQNCFPDTPLVLYLHTDYKFLFYSRVRHDEMIRGVDYLVFVSRALQRFFVALYPESEARCRVLYNGVDTDVWHPDVRDDPMAEQVRRMYGLPRGKTVLFVGRTVPKKGLHCLLEAMRVVRDRVPGAKLLVAGSHLFAARKSSPYLEAFKRRARDLGDAVVFSGYVDHRETPYYYGAADVTVMPTIGFEGFGMVAAESMAVGTPVVGSRSGGLVEVIDDGVNGVLVDDPMDVEGLAGRIAALLEDAGLRRAMGESAREKVATRFSLPARAAAVRAFYEELEASGGRG